MLISSAYKENILVANISNNLGLIYKDLSCYSEAEEYLIKSIAIATPILPKTSTNSATLANK
ncbi:MAG: tetratricopeptide repeat protein [Okeania sp. SIO2G4]|uniref:tetratricopeptide repeat protein n=1 Tax=unclassified Okeania TaxID=2634635 RepID=UPI0013BBFB2B|nr:MULTISPECIES: tetratricopeptide repeat protein [unclassified Okeania]NEP04548.1 tetratricopeptide repeat protein [Okeania sp. SIO4D6]NEP70869.1 tetratricopeptide repeat protein [Okeania sp. SIO2G5]NEP92352.1 tetratricopeptide repeat protein [Okeania sp. SIO2F5]NEQ89920.1 tetratricopeptide repeat protein [Okeania sp. SIO2G4]